MVDLIVEAGTIDALADAVRTGIADGMWTRGDVAARFVSVYHMVGGSGRPQIGAFQAARFNKVVPPPPDSAEGPAEVEVTGIDRYDLSWANRRDVALWALQHLDQT